MVFGSYRSGTEKVWSADSHKDSDASKRGDLETALQDCEPLAENGNAVLELNLSAMYAT